MNRIAHLALVCAVLSPAPADAQDSEPWSGPYVGASIVKSSSTFSWTEGSETTAQDFDLSGNGAKVYAGYNFALNGWILGAEVLVSSAKTSSTLGGVIGPGQIDVEMGPSANLTGRVGKPFGNLMPYAFAGIARSSLETFWQGASPAGTRGSNHTGNIYGVGVDYRINDSSFARLEISRSSYESKRYIYCDGGCLADQEFSSTEVSVGVGISF